MNGLSIQNLNGAVGDFQLRNINLDIPQGTILGLIGKNGAGKTTLIKTIASCLDQESGMIYYNGMTFYEHEVAVKEQLGVVFDALLLNDQLKLRRIKKLLKSACPNFDEHFYDTNLKKFNLDHQKKIAHFSLGEKKKFNIILIMSLQPKILILDEPTANIDPADRVAILDLLQSFILDEQNTILYSTHITSDLDKVADHIAMIDEGQILFCQEKDQLLEQYLLIQHDKTSIPDDLFPHLIGIRENAFGIQALINKQYFTDYGAIHTRIPTIEEIMIHWTHERHQEAHS